MRARANSGPRGLGPPKRPSLESLQRNKEMEATAEATARCELLENQITRILEGGMAQRKALEEKLIATEEKLKRSQAQVSKKGPFFTHPFH